MPGEYVLVVDDDREVVLMLQDILTHAGYMVLSATSGEEALRKIETEDLDLVLLDVMMSDMDGYEVCRRLRSLEHTRILPVIMVTALSDVEEKVKGMDAGADDFVSKPIDVQELLVRVRSMLRIRGLQRDLEERNQQLASINEEVLRTEEALHRTLRREEALGRIRDRIIEIRHLADFGNELQEQCIAELVNLGIPVCGMSVQIPSPHKGYFRSTWLDGYSASRDIFLSEFPWVEEAWDTGRPILVSREQMGEYAPDIQCILEVPMPGEGSLAVNSTAKNAFDREAIRTVEGFAGVIAEGLRRVQDFEDLLRQERQVARSEALRELLVTLSHHINNASGGISGHAELCRSGHISTDQLVEVCLLGTKRITEVLWALDRMVKEMDIREADYMGVREKMFDIEDQLKRTGEKI